MNSARWEQIKEIFGEAVELPTQERTAFVARACGADQSLLSEVQRLLRADQQAQLNLLDQPVLQWDESAETTHDKQPAGVPFPRVEYYRLLRRLGRPSGMGEVYLAQDERPGMGKRKVALKLMQARLAAKELARFKEEVAILAKLNHPHNIRLFECGEWEGRPYFVMEYFAGESLEERLSCQPLSLSEVVKITEQVCEALHEAHQQQIVHRDMKPANIMLQQDGDRIVVKVIDYGIGVLEGEATKTFAPGSAQPGIIGTVAYLSPEQARGLGRRELTRAVDIYSFGLVVYEMLVGQRAFACDTLQDYLICQQSVMPLPPSSRQSTVPPALDQVILRAVSKDPQARYATARQFADALRQTVEEVSPKPVPPPLPVPGPLPDPTIPIPGPTPLPPDPVPPHPWRTPLLALAAVLMLAAGGWGVARYLGKPPASAPVNTTTNGTDQAATRTASNATERAPGREQPGKSAPAPVNAVVHPTVKLKQEKVAGEVSFDKEFQRGDRVRLLITPPKPGYVYLVEHGTDNTVNLLYPMKRAMPSSVNSVAAQQTLEIPSPKLGTPWFEFGGKSGEERLYVVLAEERGLLPLQALEQAASAGQTKLSPQLLSVLQQQAEQGNQPGFVVQRLVLKQK